MHTFLNKTKRSIIHLVTTKRDINNIFPASALKAIEQAIEQSERTHTGEVRVVIESALDMSAIWAEQTPRERAIEVFSELHIWDTEDNNGVLVYVLLADHAIEFVADRGVNSRVPADHWQHICDALQTEFKQGRYEQGLLLGVSKVHDTLNAHFPCTQGGGNNELPNAPVLLR